MSATTGNSAHHAANVVRKWGWFVALGVVMVALGIFAWLDVVAVTIAGTIFIGAMLLVSGAFQIVHAFMTQAWRGFLLGLASGVLSVIAGLLIMREPLSGALVLTLLVMAALVASGVVRIVLAFRHRDMARWGLLAFSGVVSLVVAWLLYSTLPWSGLWVLGTLIAVELLVQGVSWISFGLALRRAG
jgi:uncharacterized membrane protein HdeD (DUF308 family)